MPCHRFVQHRYIRSLIHKIRKADRLGDHVASVLLRQRLDRVLAA